MRVSILAEVLVALMTVAGLPAPVLAGSADVVVEDAWSRASIGTSRPGAAYMTIHNTGEELVTLSDIKTDLAIRSEIHQSSTNEKGVSSMRPTGEIEIAPKNTVALKPGGFHAMLMGLTRPMIEGESFTLRLVFSDGGMVTVEIPILGIATRGPED